MLAAVCERLSIVLCCSVKVCIVVVLWCVYCCLFVLCCGNCLSGVSVVFVVGRWCFVLLHCVCVVFSFVRFCVMLYLYVCLCFDWCSFVCS
jgi:hypothetical protein